MELVKIEDYAKEKGLNPVSIINRAKRGNLLTATKQGKKWFAERKELDVKYYDYGIPSEEFIRLNEYAELNGLNYITLLTNVRNKKYNTPIRHNKFWYIDKNEKPFYDKYISVPEYAALHDMSEEEVISLIEREELIHQKRVIHGILYIHKDEDLYMKQI